MNYEHKVTLGELEEDCDDLISDVAEGRVYAIVSDNDDEPLAILMPYSMYEEFRDELGMD